MCVTVERGVERGIWGVLHHKSSPRVPPPVEVGAVVFNI